MRRSGDIGTLLVLNAYWGGLSFMWNSLHPIVLPALLAAMVPSDRKNTYLGLLTFGGLMIAMIVQPISGTISDRWTSRLGRRRPLMLIGTILDFVFLLVLGWAGGLAAVVVGYVGLQISSNIAQGPLQALLRDRVPPHHMGMGSSIKVFLDLISLVAASLVAGRLAWSQPGAIATSFLVVIGVLAGSAAVTICFTHEEPAALGSVPAVRQEKASQLQTGSAAPGYWWLIAQRFVFLLGVYGLQAFGQYYIQDTLGAVDAPKQAGNLLVVIGAGTIVFVVLAGWLTDRIGARRVLLGAGALAATGLLWMVVLTQLHDLYFAGLLVGGGMGLFLTSNWALANRMAPAAAAGRHLGLTNLATAGAAALARLEGPAVDWLNATAPGTWLGYRGVFVLGAACILASLVLLQRTR